MWKGDRRHSDLVGRDGEPCRRLEWEDGAGPRIRRQRTRRWFDDG
ncbi:unnamed protein product [Linum tenue]|uniref:Uncharacterized protein n=1 Tax=Linum tenue TaxID=586396 RepID=A0AAV0IMX3_9ROSI|nr:unnamed protein product [Linum tenue]